LFRTGRRLPLFLSIGLDTRQKATTGRRDEPVPAANICPDGSASLSVADINSVLTRFGQAPMTDEKHQSEGKAAVSRDLRQERLKQALRENLKRRKSQVRQRVRQGAAPSTCHETVLDDKSGDEGE
jgi:hypothetical protein